MINIFITVRCCLYDLIDFNNHEAAILCSIFEFRVLRVKNYSGYLLPIVRKCCYLPHAEQLFLISLTAGQ